MRPRIFSLALAGAVFLAACSGSPDSVDAGESLLRFFPPQTSAVAFVDFGGLEDHAFVGSFIEEHAGVQTPDELADFQAGTGFDFERDVRQVMAGSAGEGGGLIVVNAVYDRERVIRYVTDEGMAYADHGGTGLFLPDASTDTVFAFVDDVVLIGTEPHVRGAIDRAGGGVPSALDNARLLEDIAEIEDGYQIWATGSIDTGLIPEEAGESGITLVLASLERGTYQMRFDETITARAIGEFTSADQARTAASLLEGLRGMAMIQGVAGEFYDLLSGILIATNDTQVEIQLQLERAVLERLAESGALSR
jgi:hypothetical protein